MGAAAAPEHILAHHSSETHDQVAQVWPYYFGSDIGETPQSRCPPHRCNGHAMRIGASRRFDGKLGAKQMDLVALISKPAGGSIEIKFCPAVVIEPPMSERNFHKLRALGFGALN